MYVVYPYPRLDVGSSQVVPAGVYSRDQGVVLNLEFPVVGMALSGVVDVVVRAHGRWGLVLMFEPRVPQGSFAGRDGQAHLYGCARSLCLVTEPEGRAQG